ncbi:hypothetical protein N9D66_01235 [Candidatus Nanopelagicales bacterium]|nr:hypothetical protein [Candidatus Nanopelagicales bacterium]
MPTVEFHGYSTTDQHDLVALLRESYESLDFREDIVFVLDDRPSTRVESWEGKNLPFVRLHSRSSERLAQLVTLTVPHSDTETIRIGFHERAID